eukprot:8519979-Pyramimonas_sp.AAC.1
MSYELREQGYRDKRAKRGYSNTVKQQQHEQVLLENCIELHFNKFAPIQAECDKLTTNRRDDERGLADAKAESEPASL